MIKIFSYLKNSIRLKEIIFLDKTITSNTLSLTIIYAVNFLISLLTLPHLVKNYGLTQWGNIVFYQIIINYLIWLIDWSFNIYSTKFISINSGNKHEQKRIFNETKSAQFILLIASIIVSIILLTILGQQKLIMFFTLILFGSYLQSFWFLNGLEKIYETALIQLFNKVFLAIMIIRLINEESNIYSYFLFYGISSLITGIICQSRITFKYKIKLEIKNLRKGLKTILKSSKLFFSSIIGSLTNSSLPLIVTILLGKEQLGIYNIADRIKGISVQLAHPISHSLFPRMSKEYSKSKESANRILKIILITLIFLTSLAFIFVNVFMNQIVSYFSNENILLISSVLRVLMFSFIINVIEEIMVNHYLTANGMYNSINKLKLSILLTSLLICFPLINKFGIIGAAYSNFISELIGLIYLIFLYNKTKNADYRIQSF